MAQFSVKTSSARSTVEKEKSIAGELGEYGGAIRDVARSISFNSSARAGIVNRLNNIAGKVEECQGIMNSMQTGLDRILNSYERTERNVLSNIGKGALFDQQKQGEAARDAAGNIALNAGKGIWEIIGQAGVIGGGVKSIGDLLYSLVTGDTSKIRDAGLALVSWGYDGREDIIELAGGVKRAWQDSDVSWKEAVNWKKMLGLEADEILKATKDAGLRGKSAAAEAFKKKLASESFKKAGGGLDFWKVGGVALSVVTNGFSNYDEWKTGKISTGRAVAETIGETVVDWGKNALIGAGVAAGFAAAGIAAPALAVGAATVAVSVAADWACEKVLGKGVTEAVSDAVLDGAEWVGSKAKSIGQGISNWWNGLAGGWNPQPA